MTDPVFPDLRGQAVFITGGESGIGAALTEAFLRQGAKVAFCQRSDTTPFSDAMEAATGNLPLCLPCDISVTSQLQLTLDTAAKEHGTDRLHVNSIVPGRVLSDRLKEVWVTNESLSRHLAKQCLPDLIEPANMAGAVLFLASRTSRVMMSQTSIFDEGYASS